MAESFYAPVGFANNPAGVIKSEGNEKYYSYDGSWEKGQMHGYGHYLYEDGGRYIGEFVRNWPEGEGKKGYRSHVIGTYSSFCIQFGPFLTQFVRWTLIGLSIHCVSVYHHLFHQDLKY